MGRRQVAADETRARIVTAARDLLAADAGAAGFSIDAVARRANVARMTVYYQFGAKAGLLEALFDDLAARAEIGDRLAAAFRQTDALDALDALVVAFAHFWTRDRLAIRRLHGLAALDPEVERGDRARNERRRHGLRVIVDRLAETSGRPSPDARDEVVAVLHMLTSFETFDALAGAERSPEEVVPVVRRLVRAALDLVGW
jgi:AcrR family transcriptional regulator